jgi:acyl-CoA thioesterase FadM
VRAECEFNAPLRFGDTAETEVTIPRLGTKSITFRYRIYRAGDPRTLCAEGQVTCAVVDLARFVAVNVPEHVVTLLTDLVES